MFEVCEEGVNDWKTMRRFHNVNDAMRYAVSLQAMVRIAVFGPSKTRGQMTPIWIDGKHY